MSGLPRSTAAATTRICLQASSTYQAAAIQFSQRQDLSSPGHHRVPIPGDAAVLGGVWEDLLVLVSQAQLLWAAGAAHGPEHCQLRGVPAVVAGHAGWRRGVGVVCSAKDCIPEPYIVCTAREGALRCIAALYTSLHTVYSYPFCNCLSVSKWSSCSIASV